MTSSLHSFQPRVKIHNVKTFDNVVRMNMKFRQHQEPKPRHKPRPTTCKGCGGYKIEMRWDEDRDCLVECTCRFCGGTGVVAYAGSRQEHRDWLRQLRGLGGMAWNAVRAVLL